MDVGTDATEGDDHMATGIGGYGPVTLPSSRTRQVTETAPILIPHDQPIDVTVMSRYEAIDAYGWEHERPIPDGTALISVTGTDSPNPVIGPPRFDEASLIGLLRLAFLDVEGPSGKCMSRGQAYEVTSFVRRMADIGMTHLAVHCNAGESRSAGIGAAVAYLLGLDDKGFFETVSLSPNMWCYRQVLSVARTQGVEVLANERILVSDRAHWAAYE